MWTGVLPAERFVDLPFIALNPESDAEIVWPATQIYEGGERVDWTGPPDSDAPASVTRVGTEESDAGLGTLLGGSPLAIALVALGRSMRKDTADTPPSDF